MKIAFYQMRPFDEQAYIEQFSREFGIDYVTIPGAPCPENLDKAAGCDAVSQNPCEILPEYVEAWARIGRKVPALPQHRLRSYPAGDCQKAGHAGSPQPLPAGRCGQLRHHADADVYPQDEPDHVACRRPGLHAARQDGQGFVQLHGRRHRHRQNRPHCHCPFAGLWLQNFGLRPVPERRGGPNGRVCPAGRVVRPAATSSPCTPMPPPRTTTSSMPSRWPR